MTETFKPITNVFTELDDSTKKLTRVFKKPDSEDGNAQTTSKQNVTGVQSLRDTLTPKKRSKVFSKLSEKVKEDVFWIGINHLAEKELVPWIKSMM